jgi:hypothetical protein
MELANWIKVRSTDHDQYQYNQNSQLDTNMRLMMYNFIILNYYSFDDYFVSFESKQKSRTYITTQIKN